MKPFAHGSSPQTLWGAAALLVVSAAIVARAFSPRPTPPVDAVLSDAGFADESHCVECHVEAEQFWETGHARTLERASAPGSLAALASFAAADHDETSISLANDEVVAVQDVDGVKRPLGLDWCFGSGEHARTWVGLQSDSWGATELVEFRWTWYHESNGFDVTPGQPEDGAAGYYRGLGVLYDHPKMAACFACHATHLALDGKRLDEEGIRPGVTCQRCHGPRAQHVATEGEVFEGFWRSADQMQSINRCAECHRRADEQDEGTIRPDNLEIVRFQPVGLVQSPCFKNSPELTCVTCHDPHLPLAEQDSLGIWQCVQCHDPDVTDHTRCAAGHFDDCLSCHMPKVEMDAPIHFTDHWIRIREAPESNP